MHAAIEQGDLNDFTSRLSPSRRRRCSARSTTRATAARSSPMRPSYTERKLVFDLNPRQYRVDDVVADLRAAGLDRVALRPFFVPQTRRAAGLGDPRASGAGAQRAARAACPARALHIRRRPRPGGLRWSIADAPRSGRPVQTARNRSPRGASSRVAGSGRARSARRSGRPPPRPATDLPGSRSAWVPLAALLERGIDLLGDARQLRLLVGADSHRTDANLRVHRGPARRAARLDRSTIASPRVPGGMSKRL